MLLNNKIKISLITLIFFLVAFIGYSSPRILVYPLAVDLGAFQPGHLYADSYIYNQSPNQTVFVQAHIFSLNVDKQGETKWQPIKDTSKIPLRLSWLKTSIPIGGSKVLRLIDFNDGAVSSDEVFDIQISPTLPPFMARSNYPAHLVEGHLRLIYGYRILVIIRPDTLKPKVKLKASSSRIEFINSGNTNVLISNLELCTQDEERCQQEPVFRLYAKMHKNITIPGKQFSLLKYTVSYPGSAESHVLSIKH